MTELAAYLLMLFYFISLGIAYYLGMETSANDIGRQINRNFEEALKELRK